MQIESLGITGLFISAFVSSTIAPGGSEALLAYLVSQQNASIIQLVLIATVGNTLGALTTWGLGAWVSKKYPVETTLSPQRQKSLQMVRNFGGWALLFSWLPLIGDGLCFAGGWLRLSLASSLIAISLGKGLRYIAVAYAFA